MVDKDGLEKESGWQTAEEAGMANLPPGTMVFDGRENIHEVRMRVDASYRNEQEALAGVPWHLRTSVKGSVLGEIVGGIGNGISRISKLFSDK